MGTSDPKRATKAVSDAYFLKTIERFKALGHLFRPYFRRAGVGPYNDRRRAPRKATIAPQAAATIAECRLIRLAEDKGRQAASRVQSGGGRHSSCHSVYSA